MKHVSEEDLNRIALEGQKRNMVNRELAWYASLFDPLYCIDLAWWPIPVITALRSGDMGFTSSETSSTT